MLTLKDTVIAMLVIVILVLSIDKFMTNKYVNSQQKLIETQRKLINEQDTYIDKLEENLKKQVKQNKNILEGLDYVGKVKATTYYPVEEQTDDTPLITASGNKINPHEASNHRWIAVSRDLHSRWGGPLSFGDKIYITGADQYNGFYIVKDTMNKRWNSRIDILQTEGSPLFSFNNVKMFIVDKNNAPVFVENL